MTPTELQLLAVHKAAQVKLADICEQYLGNTYETARRKAVKHLLPFPTFQLDPENTKSPWMVSVEELASFLDEKARAGRQAWTQSQV